MGPDSIWTMQVPGVRSEKTGPGKGLFKFVARPEMRNPGDCPSGLVVVRLPCARQRVLGEGASSLPVQVLPGVRRYHRTTCSRATGYRINALRVRTGGQFWLAPASVPSTLLLREQVGRLHLEYLAEPHELPHVDPALEPLHPADEGLVFAIELSQLDLGEVDLLAAVDELPDDCGIALVKS